MKTRLICASSVWLTSLLPNEKCALLLAQRSFKNRGELGHLDILTALSHSVWAEPGVAPAAERRGFKL